MPSLTQEFVSHAVDALRRSPPEWVSDSFVAYHLIFRDLENVEHFNCTGSSYCGMASDMAERYLTDCFNEAGLDGVIYRVTSAVRNGCFHHYNVVRIGNETPLLLDLTAAQFFSRPMDALGQSWYLGTRTELRDVVCRTAEETWNYLSQKYREENFRTLWDVDYKMRRDYDFRMKFYDAVRRDKVSVLETESLYYGWEITWGDQSRILVKWGESEKDILRTRSVDGVISDRTAEIANLVTPLSIDKLTLADGPGPNAHAPSASPS